MLLGVKISSLCHILLVSGKFYISRVVYRARTNMRQTDLKPGWWQLVFIANLIGIVRFPLAVSPRAFSERSDLRVGRLHLPMNGDPRLNKNNGRRKLVEHSCLLFSILSCPYVSSSPTVQLPQLTQPTAVLHPRPSLPGGLYPQTLCQHKPFFQYSCQCSLLSIWL